MKAPKGFGKNYFSLAAIQAHVNTITLSQTSVRTHAYHIEGYEEEASLEEEDDPNELLLASIVSTPKTSSRPSSRGRRCHCNIYFKHKAICHIQRFNLPKLFILPFEFSKASISPPAYTTSSHNNLI